MSNEQTTPQAPTPPNPWMADSRPLLVEIASLSARVMELQTQVASLVSTIAAAQGALDQWYDNKLTMREAFDDLRAILESPALVKLVGGSQALVGGGKDAG